MRWKDRPLVGFDRPEKATCQAMRRRPRAMAVRADDEDEARAQPAGRQRWVQRRAVELSYPCRVGVLVHVNTR
jgi:hypothetical protein